MGIPGEIAALLLGFSPWAPALRLPAPQPKASPTCTDFLEAWAMKPSKVQFETCKTVDRPPGYALEASYRLRGSEAAAVEAWLRDRFGMAPLRFECCGWVPRHQVNGDRYPGPGTFMHHGTRFEITLYSEETVVNERHQWSTIPTFQIRVTTYQGF